MKLHDMLPIVEQIPDPRDSRRSRRFYTLPHVLIMALGATLCGHRDFVAMRDFCMARASVFKDLFGIDRIPSHDTFNRIFKIIDPGSFEALCRQAAKVELDPALGVVAIDGKHAKNAGLRAVTARRSAGGLCMGTEYTQYKDGKGSELPAMLALVGSLDLRGSVVSVDAMGAASEMAKAIRGKGGDYVMGLKANQKLSFEWARDWFPHANLSPAWAGEGSKERGGLAVRELFLLPNPREASRGDAFDFKDCQSVALLRKTIFKRGHPDVVEERMYLSSLADPERIAGAIRSHWSIENNLHWVLDVRFGEDGCSGRDKNAAKNLNLLRKMAIELLKSQGGQNMKRTMNLLNLNPSMFKKALGALARAQGE